VHRAIQTLARNPAGYFLMVEWDMHTDHIKPGLDHVLQMDALVKQTAGEVGQDTLILFTADHSFDLRVRGGKRGEPLLPAEPAAEPAEATTTRTANAFTGEQVAETKLRSGATKVTGMNVRMDNGHTGEQVLVAAQGPGAERVHGFIHNTDIFHIMMAAYGWESPEK
jgi:alkaline phosphatase